MEIKKRIKGLEKEFAELEETKKSLIEEGKALQKKLNEVDVLLVQKNGAYIELKSLEKKTAKAIDEKAK